MHRTPFKVNIPPAIFSPSSINLERQLKMTAKLLLGFIIHSFVLSVNVCEAPAMCWESLGRKTGGPHVISIFPSCSCSWCGAWLVWPMGSEQMCCVLLSTYTIWEGWWVACTVFPGAIPEATYFRWHNGGCLSPWVTHWKRRSQETFWTHRGFFKSNK